MGTLFNCADAEGLNARPTAAKRTTNADKTHGIDDLPGRAAIYVAIIARKIPARRKELRVRCDGGPSNAWLASISCRINPTTRFCMGIRCKSGTAPPL